MYTLLITILILFGWSDYQMHKQGWFEFANKSMFNYFMVLLGLPIQIMIGISTTIYLLITYLP